MADDPEESQEQMVASFFSESNGSLSDVPSEFIEQGAAARINDYRSLDTNDATKKGFVEFSPVSAN